MQAKEIFSNSKSGTVEIVLNKKEIGLDGVFMDVDYTKTGEDKYKIEFYIGLRDSYEIGSDGIMESVGSENWTYARNDFVRLIQNDIKKKLEDKEYRNKLRKIVFKILSDKNVYMDMDFQSYRFSPNEFELGTKGAEITVEMHKKNPEVRIYFTAINGDKIYVPNTCIKNEDNDFRKVIDYINREVKEKGVLHEFFVHNKGKLKHGH